MRFQEIQQDIKEVSLIDIQNKPFYSGKELDTNWNKEKENATLYQSKLFPDLVLGISEPSYMAVFLFLKGSTKKPIAYLEFSPIKNGVGWEVNIASVRSSHAGSGYGYKMYVILIKELGKILVSDTNQSKGGAKIWYNLYKTPGISVYGWDTKAPKGERFFQVHDLNNDGMLDGSDRRMYNDFNDPETLERTTSKERSDITKASDRKLVAVKSQR